MLEVQAVPPRLLAHGLDEINYRRFFDINTLAGLRVEDQEVFDATRTGCWRR